MLKSQHLIAGQWRGGPDTFDNMPVDGPAHSFAAATPQDVDDAVQAAERAFESYGVTSRSTRAAFLRSIAKEIDARGDDLTDIAMAETGLPAARLEGERGRTCGQLRLFADHIENGAYLDKRHDAALPDRAPLPRPDLRMIQRTIGPVAVFGASNFPLAFSVAGGDTASALAAGCPVVVKGHPAHPGTSDIVAQAIDAARAAEGLDPGVFALLQGPGVDLGTALVLHPLIQAVGFTGSLAGGRALFDLCVQRPVPIPFFGELGSINPVFVLDAALNARGAEIAKGWAGSLTMGAGQFCTNPGLVVLQEGPDADAFIAAATDALTGAEAQVMLTSGIVDAYGRGVKTFKAVPGVQHSVEGAAGPRDATPSVFQTDARTFLVNPDLAHEVFGPSGLIVTVANDAERMALARAFQGQLTATLQMDDADAAGAEPLLRVLERKAGRILVNGFPTGVEVSDTMVHGGPYPASTNFGATSVGTMAIRRFLRPVCYQNLPDALMDDDLK